MRTDLQPTTWAALHRKDGRELTDADAPGYRRASNSEVGWSFGETPDDWGWVHFVSLWDAPIGGNVISDPPLQPMHADWAIFLRTIERLRLELEDAKADIAMFIEKESGNV